MTDYNIGNHVRMNGLCGHGKLAKGHGCWHSTGTTVLRVFQDGGLLIENRHGFVRVAQPDQVYNG
jgi:uncharacterized protein YcaQ